MALLAIAAAATGPARAQSTTVTWNDIQMQEFNLSSQGDSQTSDDVTLTSNGGAAGYNYGSINFNGGFTFSVPIGSVFTQIVIMDNGSLSVDVDNTGWSLNGHQDQATWTGSARSVTCQINAPNVQYIEFTIAPAVRKMYTSDVSITDLVPGDTLAEGATITGRGNSNDMVYINFGRLKENGVVPQFWKNLGLPPTVIGTNGTISGTYTPVDANGRDGNAWVVTDAVINDYYGGFEVGLGGIFIPVYRTLDSIPADWTVKVEGVTQTLQTYDGGNPKMRWLEINQTDSVTLIPDNPRRVKSVTLEDAESTPSMQATPLTLEALTDGNIKVNNPKSGMQYSKNGAEKVAMTSTTTIDVVAGDKVAFYGNGTSIVRYGEKTASTSTRIYGGSAQVKAYGNIMSLVDEENFATATTLPASRTFAYLFNNNSKLIDASTLVLPATTMTDSCYWYMFGNCYNMTAAMEVLPAMTLDTACYWNMFRSCKKLTTAPLLPATTLTHNCYLEMFRICEKLSSVTCLATNIEESNHFLSQWLAQAGTDESVTTRRLYVDPSMVSSNFWNEVNFTVTAIQ